jgi:hypothetical protein
MTLETEGSSEGLLNIPQATRCYILEHSYISSHRLMPSVLQHFNLIPAIPQTVSSPKPPDRLRRSPTLEFSRYRRMFPSVKKSGREAHSSPSCSSKFKNKWSHNFTSPIRCHSAHSDIFITTAGHVCSYLFIVVIIFRIARIQGAIKLH